MASNINDLVARDLGFGNFEQAVALNKVPDYFSIFLFGRNPDIDTGLEENLVPWGVYTFQDKDNPLPMYVSSSNATDVGLTYVAVLLDGNYDEHVCVVTTNGQNPVQIVSPTGETNFIRGQIFFNVTPNGTKSVGDVFVGTESSPVGGVPNDTAKVQAAYALDQQSSSAVYTVPRGKDGLFHGVIVTTNRNSTGGASDVFLNTSENGQPVRRRFQIGVQTSGSSMLSYDLPYPVRFAEKTDIILTANVTNNNTSLAGGFQMVTVNKN